MVSAFFLVAEHTILPNSNYKIRTIVIAITSVFSVALVIALLYLAFRIWRRNKKVSFHDEKHGIEEEKKKERERNWNDTSEKEQLEDREMIWVQKRDCEKLLCFLQYVFVELLFTLGYVGLMLQFLFSFLISQLLLQEYMESAAAHLIEAPATPTFELDQLKIADLIERYMYCASLVLIFRRSAAEPVKVSPQTWEADMCQLQKADLKPRKRKS